MSEQDSTLDPASIRTRDNEEIIDDSGELERARRLLRRNKAFLEHMKERRKKGNDGDGGSNQSNDAQMMRRDRVNHSQQSREASTRRTVDDIEYRRAQQNLKKGREILRKIRGARDEDGEQNNDDQEEGGNEGNSEYSGYSKRTYNSKIWDEIYPSRDSRKSRRGRQFSRNEDRPERDHRDPRGESYRRRENGFGGGGLPAGNALPFSRRNRGESGPPFSPAADEPQRRESGPSAADVEPSAGRPEPAPVPVRREARPPLEVPPMEHPELIDWNYFKFRCVEMMNRLGPHFLKIEEISLSAVSTKDTDNIRAYGIALKRVIEELLDVFITGLKGDAPGLRKTLLDDFGRFLEQYTFNGYNTFESYPGGRWRFLTKEEFDRIKDIIQPSPPPPRSSGSDGGPSGGAGAVPDDSDRHRSGRNDGGGGPAAAGRGRQSPAAMIYGPQRRPMDPDRQARIDRERARNVAEFERGIRRDSRPAEAARPAPAPGPPAVDGGGRDFASAVVPGGEIVPTSDADGADSRAGVEPVYERAKVFSLSDLDDSDSEDGSGGGRILDGARPRLVPAPDKIVFEKGDSGENQGYARLPDDGAPQQAKSSGWLNPVRWAAEKIRKNRETRYESRVKNMDELEEKRRPWIWRRGTRTSSRVEARLRSMGHPYYQEQELN